MRLSVDHLTRYRFDGPVTYAVQRLRVTPKHTSGQAVLDWNVTVTGGRIVAHYDDQHCNAVDLMVVDAGTQEVEIRSSGTVDTADNAGVIGRHAGFAPLWHFKGATPLTKAGRQVRTLLARLPQDGDLERLHALSGCVREAIRWDTGVTHVATTAEEALAAGQGVCQDHAHAFIAAARVMGFPARYVSGYLMMEDRVEQEATHAWAEAMVDGLGWVGFDISNGISPDERHVRIATGRDYAEAAPVTGVSIGSRDSELSVRLAVEQ